MRHLRYLANSLVFVSLLLFASTQVAQAYVDPGTGSYIIQILIAVLAGAAFAVKIYWRKIKQLFSRSSSEGEATQADDE
jgi:steroid 5-alpha reductase family enzyme